MSFILDALNKKQPTHQDSQTASVDQDKRSQVQPVHTMVATSYPQFISWGVLLTLAIFAALAVGFWLGQQSQYQVIEQRLITEHKQDKQTQEITPVKADPDFGVANKVIKESETQAQRTRIDAENYFENPPVKNINNDSNTTENKATEHVITTKTAEEKLSDVQFNLKAEAGISSDLLSRFQSAIEETQQQTSTKANADKVANEEPEVAIRSLSDMPKWVQDAIPELNFSMHIYASNGEGWIRVNGDDKVESDFIATDLKLTEILPQRVVLSYQGEIFTLPALSSW